MVLPSCFLVLIIDIILVWKLDYSKFQTEHGFFHTGTVCLTKSSSQPLEEKQNKFPSITEINQKQVMEPIHLSGNPLRVLGFFYPVFDLEGCSCIQIFLENLLTNNGYKGMWSNFLHHHQQPHLRGGFTGRIFLLHDLFLFNFWNWGIKICL